MSLRRFYASVYANNFPSLVASILSWRCLAASTSYLLHAAVNLLPPFVTASTHNNTASNAVAFQSLAMLNARMSLCAQSVHHCLSFPPRSLRTAPSRFPNTIRFGTRPPLIRISTPAHKSLLVRNVAMLSHLVISRAQMNEVNRWYGLLRCAPIWCEARPGGVRFEVWRSVPGEGSKYCILK